MTRTGALVGGAIARKISSLLIISLIVFSWLVALVPVVSAAAPSMPVLSTPLDGENTDDNTPTFQWEASTDNEGDPITYDIQVDDASDFSSPAENITGLSDNSYTPSSELPDATYYWRVRALDNENLASAWSTLRSFTLSTVPVNQPPSAPALSTPAGGATTDDNTPYFSWGASSDPDGDPITYRLEVDNDNTFPSPVIDPSGLIDNSYTPTAELVDGTYYWRVGAYDNINLRVWSSTWSFTVSTAAPPENVQENIPTTLTISPSSFTLASGGSTTLTATLYDNENVARPGKTITWSATSGTFSASSGTTDSYGQVTTVYYAPTVTTQTSVTVTASFAGDDNYQSSSGSSSGTITPVENAENVKTSTTVSVSPSSFTIQSGEPKSITATLKDNADNALANKTVEWSATAGSLSATTTTTDSTGWVSITYTAPTVTAQTSVTVTASFAGDDNYQSSSGSSSGTITPVENENVVTATAFSPPHSDYGLDNNGDGVYDSLVIDVSVSIGKAGKYYVYGSLYGGTTSYTYDNYTYSSYGSYVAWAWEELSLSTGAQTVSLYFDGTDIKRSGVDGPYTASISIYDDSYTSYDWGEHTTGTYTYSQFGRATTALSPPHSDSGSDTNSDGLYDYLEVTVSLNVAAAGKYNVSGSLSRGGSENYYTTTSTWYSGYTYIDYASEDAELSIGTQSITLKFDGQKIRESKVDGPYTVNISLYNSSWSWLDSGTHTTGTYSYTDFQTPAVALAPPHSDSGSDTDGDGYYNDLVVDVNLSVTTAGTYSVSGSLTSGSSDYYENIYPLVASKYNTTYSYYGGTYIDYAWEEAELSTGTQTVRLEFDGVRIRESGLDGPYTVELYVYGPHKEESGTYSWDWGTSDYGTHTTASYTADQFQAPAASFSSPHSDEGSDTNGDGLYDYLVVSANVNVTTAGKYQVSGSLMRSSSGSYYYGAPKQDNEYETVPIVASTYGTYIDYEWVEVDLSAGTNKVELSFSGTKIRSSGMNGPYYVSLSLNDSDWNWLDYDNHTTGTYNYTDFQTLPIEFTTSHTDSGVDTDGDNLYDYLDVNVGVNVSTDGTYLIVGTISSYYSSGYYSSASPPAEGPASPTASEGGTSEKQQTTTSTSTTYTPIIAMKQATLSAGTQTVTLSFPGGLIYQSRKNGPYYISLSIVEDFGEWSTYDYGSYTTTTAYSYTDFEPPVATLSPPYTDYGSDTDGDGLYDKLVVDVKLNIRTAGSLKVLGFLMDSDGDFVDRVIKDVTLDSGEQSVKLEFKGWKIYSSHVEGSMVAGILLLDPNVEEQVWYDVGGIKIPIAGWVGLDTHYTATYSYDQFQSTAPDYTAMVVNQPVGQLSAGQATTVNLSDKCYTLENVRVAAKSGAAAPTISVIEETVAPAGVPEVEGAMSYITITVDNADGQSFTLRIPRGRLENLNMDPDAVKVYRFQDNWVEVSVEKTGEDDDYIYYKVTTPGFSVFAVTASAAQLPTQPVVIAPPIWVIVITAVALVGALIAVIWRYLSLGGKRVGEVPKPRRNF